MSTKTLPIYQVDAFTSALFSGNPAAIVPLSAWPDDELLQSIAAENNLAETAYIVPHGDNFELRWFTPAVEVDLCGHATLATAHLLFSLLQPGRADVDFLTRQAGTLKVVREDNLIVMDFPARATQAIETPQALAEALGTAPQASYRSAANIMCVFASEAEVQALTPDLRAIAALDCFAVIATAPGDAPGIDFVSRFFAPAQGIDEDPVTGSAHCTLAPFWGERLGKTRLTARQISPRGGTLHLDVEGERVKIAGEAVLYLKGEIYLPR
ncbi:MAG: PhzF family phenazine biosynthesis protein [Parvibaculaceae bacterium]|nr:PhzF family phenazine biosynthesis protein [Parvibaculaceae bacterium]